MSGIITDRHHPDAGVAVTGFVLVMERSRGSSSTSSVLAEMIRTGTGPLGLILAVSDPILVLAAVVAEELYALTMPVVRVGMDGLDALRGADHLDIDRSLVIGR